MAATIEEDVDMLDDVKGIVDKLALRVGDLEDASIGQNMAAVDDKTKAIGELTDDKMGYAKQQGGKEAGPHRQQRSPQTGLLQKKAMGDHRIALVDPRFVDNHPTRVGRDADLVQEQAQGEHLARDGRRGGG